MVRARSLEVLALLRWRAGLGIGPGVGEFDLQPSPQVLDAALLSPVAGVRRALAEALGEPIDGAARGAGLGAAGQRELEALQVLLGDTDFEVRHQALVGLCARAAKEPLAREFVAGELVTRVQPGAGRHLFDGLFVQALQGSQAQTWTVIAEHLAREEPEPSELPSAPSDAEAVWVAWRGARAVAEAGRFAGGGDGDIRTLLEGWYPARSSDERADELLKLCTRSANPKLGVAFLAGAHELSELGRRARSVVSSPAEQNGRAGIRVVSASRFSERLFAGLVPYVRQRGEAWVGTLGLEWIESAVQVMGVERAALEGTGFLHGPESRGLLLAVLSREATWPPEAVERLLALALPGEERAELRSALEYAALHGDRAAIEALLVLAEDADPLLSRAAFRLVAIAPEAEQDLADLHRIWRELPLDERIDRLGMLGSELPPGPFTDDLLELGLRHDDLRTRLARLLSRGPYTEEVHIELARWLVTELAAAAGAGGRGGVPTEGAAGRAAALLVELDRFAGERAHGDLVQAVRLLPAEVQVARAVAMRLGQSVQGRLRLAQLASLDLVRRSELEIALQLAGPHVPRAERDERRDLWLGVLLSETERMDLELLGRILGALARSEDADALRRLERIALDSLEPELRSQLALSALGTSASPIAVQALELAVRHSGNHERRVGGARGLAASVGPESGERLVRVTNQVRRAHDTGLVELGPVAATELAEELGLDLLVPGTKEELEHLLDELELGCARRRLFDQRLIEGLLWKPVTGAEADLVQRHASLKGPAPSFVYRRERELAVGLAQAGRLAEGLAPLQAVGARLDPAFLLELSEALELVASAQPATLAQLGRLAALGLPRTGEREARELDRALGLLERTAQEASETAFFAAGRLRLARSGRLGRSGLDPRRGL